MNSHVKHVKRTSVQVKKDKSKVPVSSQHTAHTKKMRSHTRQEWHTMKTTSIVTMSPSPKSTDMRTNEDRAIFSKQEKGRIKKKNKNKRTYCTQICPHTKHCDPVNKH